MKARVIKEWEMYGITHKVGEIMTIPLHSSGGLPMISDRDAFLLDNGFIEEMKEPLIKDEKIREVIRGWAKTNDVANVFITVVKDAKEGYLYWELASMAWEQSITIRFGGELPNNLENMGAYTIDELCGWSTDEEENERD